MDFSIFSTKVRVYSASVFRVATHYPYQNSTLDLFSRPFLKASNSHLHDKLHQSTILEFSVMFHFVFVHCTFSSVWVAGWPPFGKWLPARLAICSRCILSVCGVNLFPALVLRAGFAF